MLKIEEYPAEMARVKEMIAAAKSHKQKRDLFKYLNRLKREKREYEALYERR